MTDESPRLVRAAQPLAALLALATAAWLVAGLDRGFEITDEAYYLLSAIHAHAITAFFTPFHWVTGPLWHATGSLFAFRAAGLALSIASALVLAWGAIRAGAHVGLATPQSTGGHVAMASCAAGGAMLYGALLNFTPSYNLLASIASCMAFGLAMLAVGTSGHRAAAWSVAAGVVLALAAMSKFPAGVCTAGLAGVAMLGLAKGRERWNFAWLLAACVVTLVLFVFANGGPATAASQFRAGIGLVWSVQGDGGTFARLVRSAHDIARLFAGTFVAFWGPLACFAVALFWRSPLPALAGATWLALSIAFGGHLAGGFDHFLRLAWPTTAIVLCVLMAKSPASAATGRARLLLACIAALPFGIAIGTWNPLEAQVVASMAPWGTLIGLLAFAQPLRLPAALCALLFGGVVLAQVTGVAQQPYRMHPLAEHVEAVQLPGLGEVRVDPATAEMAEALMNAAKTCGIAPGRPFIDLYDLPGAGLLLQGRPVVAPWMLHADYATRVLDLAKPQDIAAATLLVQRDAEGRHPKLPPQLAQFPEGRRLCGKAEAPVDGRFFEVWAP